MAAPSDIEDLIAKGVDLLLVTAASPSAISPVVEKAIEKGIVVVTFDNLVETDKVTVRVEANESGIGTQNMEWLCKKLGGKGQIVMLGGIESSDYTVDTRTLQMLTNNRDFSYDTGRTIAFR